jgi:hypothetical protein
MAIGVGTDPDIRPRRWDTERGEAGQLLRIPHSAVAPVQINKTGSSADPAEARLRIARVAQPCQLGAGMRYARLRHLLGHLAAPKSTLSDGWFAVPSDVRSL